MGAPIFPEIWVRGVPIFRGTHISVTPCHPEEEQKGEMRFFENIFSLDFLTCWLSYSTYSIITGSRTQQVNFMEKFCVKAGISCTFILY